MKKTTRFTVFLLVLCIAFGISYSPVLALEDDNITVNLDGIEIETDYSSSEFTTLEKDGIIYLYNNEGILEASWEIIPDSNPVTLNTITPAGIITPMAASETILHKRYIGSSILGFYVNYNVGYNGGTKYILSKNYDKVEWVSSIGIYNITSIIKWANVGSGLYPRSFDCHYNVTIKATISVSLSASIKAELKAIGFSFDASATTTVYSVKTFYDDFTLRIYSTSTAPCYQQGNTWVCPLSNPIKYE